MDYSGLGAALQSFGGFMTDRAERKEYEKKEKERLEAAKKAQEEAERKRVERRQLYLKQPDYSYGPPQLAKPTWYEMGTNAQGEVVQDIPANAAQLFNIEQESAAARAKSEAAAKEEERDRLKFEGQMSLNKARESQAYAGARASDARAKNLANPSAGNEATLWKDINNLLGDPDYQAAVQAGDPSVLREMGASDPVIGGLRATGKAIGVDVPEDSRPNLLREIEQEQDPAVRAQMLASFKRRLEMAAAKGRSGGKGIRPPRNQE